MRRVSRSAVGTAVGVVLASSIVAVASTQAPAAAKACTVTWDGMGDGTLWTDQDNWGDDGVPAPGDVVCITTTDHVAIDALQAQVAEVQLGGSTELEIRDGASLLVDGGAESVWGPSTNVAINNGGELGGTGTIRVQGFAWFASPGNGSVLTSGAATGGKMVVEGVATVVANGLGISGGYHVDVVAGGRLRLDPKTWITGDPGTATTIRSGAALELTGDGGYYQGAAGSPSVLTNSGVLRKTGGTGTSVVDASYQGSGQVEVRSGAIAMPDGQLVGGAVWPGYTLATGRCGGPSPDTVCQPTQDPAKDVMSLELTVPSANPGSTGVQIQELGPVATSIDSQRIGNEVLAHADSARGRQRPPGEDRAALLPGRRDEHTARRGAGRAHHRRHPAGRAARLRQRRPAERALELRGPAGRAQQPEHIHHRAHHADQPLACAPHPAGREPGCPDGAARRGRQGGQAVRRVGAHGVVDRAGVQWCRAGLGVPRVRRRQAQGLAARYLGEDQERRAGQAHGQGRRRERRRHERDGLGRHQAGQAVQASQGGRREGEGRRPGDGHAHVEGTGRRGRTDPEEVRGRDLQGRPQGGHPEGERHEAQARPHPGLRPVLPSGSVPRTRASWGPWSKPSDVVRPR